MTAVEWRREDRNEGMEEWRIVWSGGKARFLFRYVPYQHNISSPMLQF